MSATSLDRWNEWFPEEQPVSDIIFIPKGGRKMPESLARWYQTMVHRYPRRCCAHRMPDSWIKAGRFFSGDPHWIPNVNYFLWYLPEWAEQ